MFFFFGLFSEIVICDVSYLVYRHDKFFKLRLKMLNEMLMGLGGTKLIVVMVSVTKICIDKRMIFYMHFKSF